MRFTRFIAMIGLVCGLSGQSLAGDPDWLSPIASPTAQEALSPALSSSWFSAPDTTYELGDSWTMNVGGEYRARYQKDTNRGAPTAAHANNSFYLGRLLLHADIQTSMGWDIYLEAIDARSSSEDLAPSVMDRNTLDMRNYYMRYSEGDTVIRIGRTDLRYGAERLVSNLDWANVRRSFEGVVLHQKMQGGAIDVFLTHPVTVTAHERDRDDDSNWFSGIYTTWDLDEPSQEGVDIYLLALNETSDRFSEFVSAGVSGPVRGRDIYTIGARHWTAEGDLDTEVEFARQSGLSGGATVRAYSFTARAGMTFYEADFVPRIGIDLDYASGDDNPFDTRKGTFNQLFPLAHAYLGLADLIGRQNIIDISPNLTMLLDEMTTLKLSLHNFHLADKHDAAYNAAGGVLASDPTFSSGRFIGNEFDISLLHEPDNPAIDQIMLGLSVFSPGHFVKANKSRSTIRRVFAQATARF